MMFRNTLMVSLAAVAWLVIGISSVRGEAILIQASRINHGVEGNVPKWNLYLPDLQVYDLPAVHKIDTSLDNADLMSIPIADSTILNALSHFGVTSLKHAFEPRQISGPLGPLDLSAFDQWYRVELPSGVSADACVDSIRKLPEYWAEVSATDVVFETNDPYWGIQAAGYLGGGTGAQFLDLPAIWEWTPGDTLVVVGVLDNGTRRQHQDFLGVTIFGDPGFSSTTFGHGSAITSIIGALTDNGFGMAGMAKVRMSMRRVDCVDCFDYQGTNEQYLQVIADGAVVTNSSFFTALPRGQGQDPLPLYSPLVHAAYVAGYNAGVTNIASAGNTWWHEEHSPADFMEVIAFEAADQDGLPGSDFPWTEFGAKGSGIVGISPLNDTAMVTDFGGSSAASAQGSGLAALAWSWALERGDTLDNDDMRGIFSLATAGIIPRLADALELMSFPASKKRFTATGPWAERSEEAATLMFGINGGPYQTYRGIRHMCSTYVSFASLGQDYWRVDGVWANGPRSVGARTHGIITPANWAWIGSWDSTGFWVYSGFWTSLMNLGGTRYYGDFPVGHRDDLRAAYSIAGEIRLPVVGANIYYDTAQNLLRVGCVDAAENEDSWHHDVRVGVGDWQEDYTILPADLTGFEYTDLQGSQNYAFRVHPENIHQVAPDGPIAAVFTRPNKPENVQASLVEHLVPASAGAASEGKDHSLGVSAAGANSEVPAVGTEVEVTWEPPLNQVNAVDHYEINAWRYGEWHYVYPCEFTNCCPCKVVEVFSDITELSKTICLDLKDHLYEISVFAIGSDGQVSRASAPDNLTTGDRDFCVSRYGLPEDHKTSVPRAFSLSQNYPNPFNSATTIEFSLAQGGLVALDVYNILGQQIARLVEENLPAGLHTFEWNGRDFQGRPVSSGIYVYRLSSQEFTATRKMILLK